MRTFTSYYLKFKYVQMISLQVNNAGVSGVTVNREMLNNLQLPRGQVFWFILKWIFLVTKLTKHKLFDRVHPSHSWLGLALLLRVIFPHGLATG